MIIQHLPSYSTERYFLLSEIEQKSRLFFRDEIGHAGGTNEVPVLDSPMVVLYTKWCPLLHDEGYLFDKISQLLNMIKIEDALTSYIIVDAFINHAMDWTCGALNPLMESVIEGLKEKTGIYNIVIGITDNTAGLPGLEKCYDFMERIAPGYQSFSIICDLVTEDRIEMMGHDPALEPDARSGIFQVLCSSQDAAAEELAIKSILNRLKRKKNNSSESSATGGLAGLAIAGVSPSERAVYLVAIVLVMYYISLYIKM
jgi:hypothetical protein